MARTTRPRNQEATFAGQRLPVGQHALTLRIPGLDLDVDVMVLVGQRDGPKAFVVGGIAPGDAAGLGVARALAKAVDLAELSGSMAVLGRANPTGVLLGALSREDGDSPEARLARWLFGALTDKAAFGVEVRSGPAGRPTAPHLRADLGDQRVRRLARAFGLEVILDRKGGIGSLRRTATASGVATVTCEGGEVGRYDGQLVARATKGIVNLLRAHRMLAGEAIAPLFRVVLDEAVWLRGGLSGSEGGGWPEPQVPAGGIVKAGSPLLRLYDDAGRETAVVVAPTRGLVLSLPALAHVPPRSPLLLLGRLRTSTRRLAPPEPSRLSIGWCEWVGLPDLGIARLRAKIDSGARTSALHVRSMTQIGEVDGHPVLDLRLPKGARARLPVEEYVTVRDSGGHTETRPVIQTTMVLGPVRRRVRITLTDRGDMLFPMLVGRTALGSDFIVDATARYLITRGAT